jgi:hypothetical protein
VSQQLVIDPLAIRATPSALRTSSPAIVERDPVRMIDVLAHVPLMTFAPVKIVAMRLFV